MLETFLEFKDALGLFLRNWDYLSYAVITGGMIFLFLLAWITIHDVFMRIAIHKLRKEIEVLQTQLKEETEMVQETYQEVLIHFVDAVLDDVRDGATALGGLSKFYINLLARLVEKQEQEGCSVQIPTLDARKEEDRLVLDELSRILRSWNLEEENSDKGFSLAYFESMQNGQIIAEVQLVIKKEDSFSAVH